MGFGTMRPTSNEAPREKVGQSKWLEANDLMDEFALLLNGMASRCKTCRKAVRNHHLNTDRLCPDCR